MKKKNKLPRYTLKTALAKVAPCDERYNMAWMRKQFGRKRYITARDVLNVPVKEFKWGLNYETPTRRKLYATHILCSKIASLHTLWVRWKRSYPCDRNTRKEIKFALELLDHYEKGKIK